MVSSLRIGAPSRVNELRHSEAVALAIHSTTASNFSDALDSATGTAAPAQPRQGERDGPFAEGRSTPAAALVPTPAKVLVHAEGVEDAAPARPGVNAKAGPHNSADVLRITVSPLDPGRPAPTLLSQATADPDGASPPNAPSLGEEPSKPGREVLGQADTRLVEDAAPHGAAVNVSPPQRNSRVSVSETPPSLDPSRSQEVPLLPATAEPGKAAASSPTLSVGQASSQPGRQMPSQDPEPSACPLAARPAPDPAEEVPGLNARISLAAVSGSRYAAGLARDLIDKGVEPDPVGLQAADELPTRRLDAASPHAGAVPAAAVDGRRSEKNRPAAQTGTLDIALGVMSTVPTSTLVDSNTVALPSADQGDDRRPEPLGIESTKGLERRGEAGVAGRLDHAGSHSAATEPNADSAGYQIVTEQEPAVDIPTSLTPTLAAELRGHSSTTGLASVDPDAAERSIATSGSASKGGLVVATSPVQRSASATPDPSIAVTVAIPVSAPTTAADGRPDRASLEASAANSLPANLPDQLLSSVIESIQSPGRELILRLDPPELGNLTVRVLVSGREVATWFATPQLQLQQAIGQAIGQLQTDLSNAGYTLSGAWVGADTSSPRDRGASLPLAPRERFAAIGVEPETPPAAKAVSSSSGVSIYV